MTNPIFVLPATEYPSYFDLVRLIGLSGFHMTTPDVVRLDDPDATYIFTGPEGIPNCTGAQARTIFWQLEYAGDYANQPNRHTVGETWGSDPGWCGQNDARFVLLGSDERLSFGDHKRALMYPLVMLAYMTPRRQAVRDRLAYLPWPENYPGHNTLRRHEVLLSSGFMLIVHQHDGEPHYLAPLRLALAAAYCLPVICEDVAKRGPYSDAIYEWAGYDAIVDTALAIAAEPEISGRYRNGLGDLLCREWPFKRCVEAALKT